ncbi:ABC transporter permease [Paraburkholderia terrae]|uniref:Transport permease protein n=1 Tax=Paraburkholderia terrae TaxID=311230 RepID=A0A2I8EL01_9BURK|nr:ABC transporter permease [Paraburkholderia terrae]AUT60275.1 ABC transporter permease [Paraburkholderia terrae]
MSALLSALIRYRGFIIGSVKREFQTRYRTSMLGAAWLVLQPLAMILVYTVIFAGVMKSRMPGTPSTFGYSIYLCAGILTWGLFAEIVSRGQNVFVENANLLKKLSFPRIALPVIVTVSALMNFAIIFSLFTIFLVISGNFPGLPFLALIPLLLVQIVFAIGLGISLGVLNVFFRDVGQFMTIFLQFWFWFTPVVYPWHALPEQAKSFVKFNPMADLIMGYQAILVNHEWPDWNAVWPVLVVGLLLCVFGLYLFRRHAAEMVDEL